MSIGIQLTAVVVVPGVPPNWSNRRQHPMVRAAAVKEWRHLAWYASQSARNAARWPLPRKTDPPAPRYVAIELFKHAPLYDPDGALGACKPLLDGIVGVLLVDDSLAWCQLTGIPEQHIIPQRQPERTVIRVSLTDPRT